MKAILVIAADADEPSAKAIADMLEEYRWQSGQEITKVEIHRQERFTTITEEFSKRVNIPPDFLAMSAPVHSTVSPKHIRQQVGRTGKGQRKANKADRWR